MDARMFSGLGVELRLWNWPVFMQLQMNIPIRRALMLFFKQNNVRARARHPPAPFVYGKVHAPSSDTANKYGTKGLNSESRIHPDHSQKTKIKI